MLCIKLLKNIFLSNLLYNIFGVEGVNSNFFKKNQIFKEILMRSTKKNIR